MTIRKQEILDKVRENPEMFDLFLYLAESFPVAVSAGICNKIMNNREIYTLYLWIEEY